VDRTSPIVYGFDGDQLPVFFRNDVVLNAGGGRGGFQFANPWANTTPMASRPDLAPLEPTAARDGEPDDDADAEDAGDAPSGATSPFASTISRFAGRGADDPRVVLAFPDDPGQMLLSGTLSGGEALAARAQVVDAPLGEGHLVMFSIRPFWRWQTQGTFFLGFNAILNWNDLGAGVVEAEEEPAVSQVGAH
jgi:hypothetical protein